MKEELFASAEERSRYFTYKNMARPCQDVAMELRDVYTRLAELDLLRCYDFGAKLNAIAARPGKYGAEAVQQLAEYKGLSESDIYLMRQMAGKFPRSVVEEAAKRTTIEGWHLTSRHFFLVVGLKSESERMEKLESLFTNPPSARELGRAIKASSFDKKRSRRERQHEADPQPTAPLRAIVDIAQRSASFNDRVDRWAQFVFDSVDEMPPDDFTSLHVAAIKKARDQVGVLSANAQHIRDQLRGLLNRVEMIMESRQAHKNTGPLGTEAPVKEFEGQPPDAMEMDAGEREEVDEEEGFDWTPDFDEDLYSEDPNPFEPEYAEYDFEFDDGFDPDATEH